MVAASALAMGFGKEKPRRVSQSFLTEALFPQCRLTAERPRHAARMRGGCGIVATISSDTCGEDATEAVKQAAQKLSKDRRRDFFRKD